MEDCVETIIHLSIFEHYIARLKIEHYKKLLETDIDEIKRQIVLRLLAEEQANLVGIVREAEKDLDQTEKDPDQKSAVNG
jgi:ABC-type siderophore export system fused ATPase/permease subunit